MGSVPLTTGPERNCLGLWRIGEDLPGSLIHQDYASVRERDWYTLCVPGLRSALCRPAGIRLTTDLATPRTLRRVRPLSASKYNQSPPKTTWKSKSRPLPGIDLIVPPLTAWYVGQPGVLSTGRAGHTPDGRGLIRSTLHQLRLCPLG